MTERAPKNGGTAARLGGERHVALGERLREERTERGLSLRELARRLEVSPSLVSQIETGKIQPSVRTLYAMVSELGVSLDDVFGSGDAGRADAKASVPGRRAGLGRPGAARRRKDSDRPRGRCAVGASHNAERARRRVSRHRVSARKRVGSRRRTRASYGPGVRDRAPGPPPSDGRVRGLRARARRLRLVRLDRCRTASTTRATRRSRRSGSCSAGSGSAGKRSVPLDIAASVS